MIRHIVLLDLLPDYDRDELADVVEGVKDLQQKIAGFTHFDHGSNRNFEGMSVTCTYGFVCHFANEDTSRRFIVDPDHNALGQRLVNMCRGGVKGMSVIDLDLTA